MASSPHYEYEIFKMISTDHSSSLRRGCHTQKSEELHYDDDLEITCQISKLLKNIKPYSGGTEDHKSFSDFLKQLEAAIKIYMPHRIKCHTQRSNLLKLRLLHMRLSGHALNFYSYLTEKVRESYSATVVCLRQRFDERVTSIAIMEKLNKIQQTEDQSVASLKEEIDYWVEKYLWLENEDMETYRDCLSKEIFMKALTTKLHNKVIDKNEKHDYDGVVTSAFNAERYFDIIRDRKNTAKWGDIVREGTSANTLVGKSCENDLTLGTLDVKPDPKSHTASNFAPVSGTSVNHENYLHTSKNIKLPASRSKVRYVKLPKTTWEKWRQSKINILPLPENTQEGLVIPKQKILIKQRVIPVKFTNKLDSPITLRKTSILGKILGSQSVPYEPPVSQHQPNSRFLGREPDFQALQVQSFSAHPCNYIDAVPGIISPDKWGENIENFGVKFFDYQEEMPVGIGGYSLSGPLETLSCHVY